MKTLNELINCHTFRVIDQTNITTFHGMPYHAMTSFAIDDALATGVSDQLSPPTMRLWVHPKTVVLGILDAKTPYLEEGVNMLRDKGYRVVVRNSGGLAVVLDQGVLNISLVLPNMKHISIYDCYEAMVTFVQHMMRDLTTDIQAYEIIGSYCPGDYDLSIHGKKFAGISQRRIKEGAAIQIYLDVLGNSYERATLVKDFYKIAIKNKSTTFDYPTINPETMASLTDLLGKNITIEEMKRRAIISLEHFSKHIVTNGFTEEELETFSTRLDLMKKRNEKIADI